MTSTNNTKSFVIIAIAFCVISEAESKVQTFSRFDNIDGPFLGVAWDLCENTDGAVIISNGTPANGSPLDVDVSMAMSGAPSQR